MMANCIFKSNFILIILFLAINNIHAMDLVSCAQSIQSYRQFGEAPHSIAQAHFLVCDKPKFTRFDFNDVYDSFMKQCESSNDEQYYLPLLYQVIKSGSDNIKDLENDKNILIQAHDWGIKHKPQLLKQSYKKLITRYQWQLLDDEKKGIYGNKRGIDCSLYHILKCYEEIDHKETYELKLKWLLDEEMPTKMRVRFLDELLLTHLTSYHMPFDYEIRQLPSSPFKHYARTLMLLALDQTAHQSAYFASRAKLLKLNREYPDDFPKEPTVLKRYYKPLFNAFNRLQELENHHIHITIEPDFKNIFFSEDPSFFGYIREQENANYSYKLYACNKEMGIPIWISSIRWKKARAYTVGKNAVYCTTDNNNIAIIDLATGDFIQEISSPDNKRIITQLHICGSDTLCAIHVKHVSLINIKTEHFETIPLPQTANSYDTIIVNQNVIIPTEEELLFINDSGIYKQIPHHSHLGLFGAIESYECAGTSEFIVYQKRDSYDKQSLVCLDTEKYNPIWQYPLDNQIRQMQISPSDGTIFVLTESALLALNPRADDEHRILWEKELVRDFLPEIDAIHISRDGSTLYGIQTDYGELFSFDVHTGLKQFLYESHEGRSTKIVGDFAGKLYLKGTYY